MPAALAYPVLSMALMLLAAEPARQPAPGSDAELEALIPDAAVRDPQTWAGSPAPAGRTLNC